MICCLFLLGGCGAKRQMLMQDVRKEISASRFEKAYEAYNRKLGHKKDQLDVALNLGLLAFEANKYGESKRLFHEAERIYEDRKTKSVSRGALALTSNDLTLPYSGSPFDAAMIHYYLALSYMAEGDSAGAIIEGRKISQILELNSRESKREYKDDGFLQWFSGSLYESAGQVNDAWISYKHARAAYQDYYGLPEPDFLCPVTYGAAELAGVGEFEPELKGKCPDAIEDWNPGYGRVIIIAEAGQAPPIEQETFAFPIMKYDNTRWADDDERDRFGMQVYERGYDYDYDRAELDYLVTVALPRYDRNRLSTRVEDVIVRDAGNREFQAEYTQPVGAILRQDLKDRMPGIVTRAIIRGVLKYTAAEAAEEAGQAVAKDNKDKKKDDAAERVVGKLFKFAVNAAGALSESADTRSWETLPDKIFVADFQLPPGTHTLRVIFSGPNGETLMRKDMADVAVKAGDVLFLRARCVQ